MWRNSWSTKAPPAEEAPLVVQDEGPPRQPTLTFVVPFPEPPLGLSASGLAKLPPFLLYAPLAARFEAPEEGEKESLQRKAQRKWQEHEAESRAAVAAGTATIKEKAVGNVSKAMSWVKSSPVEFLTRTPAASELKELRIVYPESMPAVDIQEKFNSVLKATKTKAIRNGIISTAILPFVFVVDTLIMVPGPFEVCEASCRTDRRALLTSLLTKGQYGICGGFMASRAASIANGVASNKVQVSFLPDPRLEDLAFRLHELCWEHRKIGVPMEKPRWTGEHPPMQGVELAALVLALINMHLELGACIEYERDLERVSEDLEGVLLKGAKEWLAVVG